MILVSIDRQINLDEVNQHIGFNRTTATLSGGA
jgi:hypothetical protein